MAASSQILELALLFPLLLLRALFGRGLISSIETTREAASGSRAIRVDVVVLTTSFVTLGHF